MKKVLFSSLLTMLLLMLTLNGNVYAQQKTTVNQWKELMEYLGSNIRYPKKAVSNELQGSSVVLFSVVNGKLKDLRIENELGDDCDTEVLNRVLSFPKYTAAKDGKYALKTTFRLDGSNTAIKNAAIKTPDGFTELDLTIVGYLPTSHVSDSSNESESSSKALLILNGEVLENSNLNVIKPDVIESIAILKNESAKSLYGEKGKNGVIVVTTKKTTPELNGSVKGIAIQKIGDKYTGTTVIIKGENTSTKADPLIVVNGKTATFNSIDPKNIASVTILKDSTSTALYGDKGKNGVIIVTTKVKESITEDVLPKGDGKNEEPSFIIRDKNYETGKEPLYIVNGEVVEDISNLSPGNIKAINVTKSGNQILLHGEKGKNGVISITTKMLLEKENTQKTNDKQKF